MRTCTYCTYVYVALAFDILVLVYMYAHGSLSHKNFLSNTLRNLQVITFSVRVHFFHLFVSFRCGTPPTRSRPRASPTTTARLPLRCKQLMSYTALKSSPSHMCYSPRDTAWPLLGWVCGCACLWLRSLLHDHCNTYQILNIYIFIYDTRVYLSIMHGVVGKGFAEKGGA